MAQMPIIWRGGRRLNSTRSCGRVFARHAEASSGERTRLAGWRARPALANFVFSLLVLHLAEIKIKLISARRRNQHARHARSPEHVNAHEAIRRVGGGIVRARIRG